MTPVALPITVIVPVYNRETTLERTLRSVDSQRGYRVKEIVIVDDCSTDGSASLAEGLGYRVVRMQKNGGAALARNEGLRLSNTPWVCFLDSDDCWESNLLTTLWPHTQDHVLVSGSAYLFAGERAVSLIGPSEFPGVTLRTPLDVIDPENRIVTSSALVRTDIVRRVNGFKTTLDYSEDLDLWLRVLEHGPGWCDATPTIQYNRGPTSKSQHSRGVDEARVSIVYSFAGAEWWEALKAERFLGSVYWDATRTALRGRQWLIAAEHLSKIASRRARILGCVASVARHRRLRQRLRRLEVGRGSAPGSP